jgi:hypothetical protein
MAAKARQIDPNLRLMIYKLLQNEKLNKAIAAEMRIMVQTMTIPCWSHNIKTATDMMIQTTQGCSGTIPTLNEPTTNTGEQEMTKIMRWSFSMKITEKVNYLSEEATWKGLEALKPIRRVVGTI